MSDQPQPQPPNLAEEFEHQIDTLLNNIEDVREGMHQLQNDLEQFQQHIKDIEERLANLERDQRETDDDLHKASKILDNIELRLGMRPVLNCRNCGRQVRTASKKCGVCNTQN